VVCERGGAAPNNARVDKSLAVKNAGGVGVVLYNVAAGASLNADFHSLPTVHINTVDGAAVVAYVNSAGTGATAKINQSTIVSTRRHHSPRGSHPADHNWLASATC
jgi:hypothetical protein